ncbi:hypothetical protein [Burkholderia pyrrocinia]|uniref:hypothetical protein n=1 Tax=Burkholderia pyrrocinia TaxID=60550 RepID=UPI00158A093C|nr:hypothetical protein [Burkholderia pyrrocinia]
MNRRRATGLRYPLWHVDASGRQAGLDAPGGTACLLRERNDPVQNRVPAAGA